MQFFGLFGEHLSHSYSERIHSTFFVPIYPYYQSGRGRN